MDPPPEITYLGFNQDQTCLAVGTRRGFVIFSTENFAMLHQEDSGAVSLVEMLFRTSLLALVGCSPATTGSPSPAKELTMWNTKERCSICQLHFGASIEAVKMNHRRIVVLLRRKIHIFDLRTTKSLHVIDRAPSPVVDPALGWLCAASEHGLLATPVATPGAAAVGGRGQTLHMLDRGGDAECKLGFVALVDTHTLKAVGTVLAHRSPVRALCLNPTGQLLATASVKGTVVRLFGVPELEMLYSFRRGANSCQIFGLLFSRDSAHICASAASGTVHVFKNSAELLGALPLQTEEATVGAAQREMMSRTAAPGADSGAATETSRRLPPLQEATSGSGTDATSEDLLDWNVIAERPERLLELSMNVPSYGSNSSRANTMQVLSAVSDFAVESTTKYAKSLLQLLPQPCREMLDAPRAFAWIHLREDGRPRGSEMLPAEGWLQDLPKVHGLYVACINSKPAATAGRSEVLVATVGGCTRIYEWSTLVGGECRLRSEHSFMTQSLGHTGASSLHKTLLPT